MIGVACGSHVFTMCCDIMLASHSALVFFVPLPVISIVEMRAEALAIRESLVQGQARGIVRRPAPRQAVDCTGRGMMNIRTGAHDIIFRREINTPAICLPLSGLHFSERFPRRRTRLCHVWDSTLGVQISSVIMINCGGTIDIVDFLQPPPDATIYILDSHRPYHLNNVREHIQQVHHAGF
jgi:hypothetical protein